MNLRPRVYRAAVVAAAISFLTAAGRADDYHHFGRAQEAFKQQVYMSAVSEAQAQLRDTPNHVPSWILISRIYLKLNKCADAGAAVASAYSLLQQNPGAASGDELQGVVSDLTN